MLNEIFRLGLKIFKNKIVIYLSPGENYTVTNGSAAFETLQEPIPHITVYYICIHKLITFLTLLHNATSA